MVDKAPEGTSTGGKSPLDYAEKAVKSNFDPKAIAEVVVTLDEASREMIKQFGQGQAMADILRSSMADSVTSVRKLGGALASGGEGMRKNLLNLGFRIEEHGDLVAETMVCGPVTKLRSLAQTT